MVGTISINVCDRTKNEAYGTRPCPVQSHEAYEFEDSGHESAYIPWTKQCIYMSCDIRMHFHFGWGQQIQSG